MHSVDAISEVLDLLDRGLTHGRIAQLTGVPRSTVRDWGAGKLPNRWGGCELCAGDGLQAPGHAYAYLLGMYLGDGCVSRHPRAYRLRIVLDSRYLQIVEECAAALRAVRPKNRAWVGAHGRGCVAVSMYYAHWPCLLPQHGPGKKHLRTIELLPWQRRVVEGHRKALVRGLIHSDGCRVVANDRGVESVRYHFSNLSQGIQRIYTDCLDALDVPWTQPSTREIAVYRRRATAFIDTFVGPKR